jgi:P27 family predicted phage terminase small subunit
MQRGRRSKPLALKDAQGFPGKKRKVKGSSGASDAGHLDSMESPAKLDAGSKRVWQHLVPMLRERKFIQATDLRTLARYCKFLSLFEAIAPSVNAKNIVVTTVSDAVTMDRLNKNFLALLHLDSRLEKMEDRFGLSPQARQTILAHAAAQAPRLPFEDQIAGGKNPQQHVLEPPKAPSPIGMGRLN